jgi:hypothetical protein
LLDRAGIFREVGYDRHPSKKIKGLMIDNIMTYFISFWADNGERKLLRIVILSVQQRIEKR